MNKNRKVLSIDDSPSIRRIVKSCLEKKGFSVDESANGISALEKIKNDEHFDALVVDVHMPEMDGISFVKEFRKTDEKTPVIMLTTESATEQKNRAKQAGANGWIIKPFDPDKFVKVIDRLTVMQ